MLAPSPQPLTAQTIEEYRTVMTRVDPDDWEGHRRRVEAARALGRRAFLQKDRSAWEVAQVVEWRLQRRSSFRPTEPGDVHVLDTLYRLEEEAAPPVQIPSGLSPEQFCKRLTEDIAQFNAVESNAIKLLESGKLTRDDWRYFSYHFIPPSGDFTKMLAVASMRLPSDVARFAFENLFEEGGEGDPERAHVYLLAQFLRQFDINPEDEETVLYWVPPEILANTNGQNRMLWHTEPGWSLGSMFLMEKLLPLELASIRDGLVRSGIDRRTMTWFDVHISEDEHHAQDWLNIVASHLLTFDAQKLAYVSAMERGRLSRVGWDAAYQGWEHWKRTGVPTHAPAQELRAATGL
jgi:hypothetical protein